MMNKAIYLFAFLLSQMLTVNHLLAQPTNKIDSVGNIGIGTTSPASRLTIKQSSDPSVGSNSTQGVRIYNAGGTSFGQFQVTATGVELSSSAGDVDLPLFFNVGRAAIPPMTIMTDQRIGFGTTSPASKIHAVGGLTLSGAANSSSARIDFGVTGGAIFHSFIYNDATGALNFDTDGSERHLNFLNSNVGIGTSTPTEKLFIEGNVFASGNISAIGFIKTKKLTVTQTAWPDYVFNKNYKLRNLSSLESFIKQNKHLPGVPSAKEVEEKGISVGDNQALLLKKIEELTLYIIELHKNDRNQLRIIQELRQEIKSIKVK